MTELTQQHKDFLLTAPREHTIGQGCTEPKEGRLYTFQADSILGGRFIVIQGSYFCKSDMKIPLWSKTDIHEVISGVDAHDPLLSAFCIKLAMDMYDRQVLSTEPATNVVQLKFPKVSP